VDSQSSEGVGQSFANLFSLGAHRTLTLVDGMRFVSSASASLNGPLGGVGEQVDLNVIPTELVDRVDLEYVKSDGLLESQRPRTAKDLMFLPPAGRSPYQYVLYSGVCFRIIRRAPTSC
jgi:hypothetical protein